MQYCYLDTFIKHSEEVVNAKLSQYQKLNYNRFMWWRTHCDKTEPLSKRVPLKDRIINGDFEFSSYYWQAQSAAIVGRNKLDLTKDDYRDQIDKTTIDIARYRRLIMDFEKEEGNRIQEFIESFTKAFNLTREEIYAELETWGGDMLGFYNYLSTGYPLSPYESRKIARKQSRKSKNLLPLRIDRRQKILSRHDQSDLLKRFSLFCKIKNPPGVITLSCNPK